MSSVTQRLKEIKQPRGGFIAPASMTCIKREDGKEVALEENIPPHMVGVVVDYLTRFLIGADIREAFDISLKGATRKSRLDGGKSLEEINGYIDEITGLDDKSIINACKATCYDVWLRNAIAAFKAREAREVEPDRDTINNIRIFVERSISFWDEYGPITVYGFTFEPNGYTQTVDSGDGDYLTKDALWDFKVSYYSPTTINTLQLLMYYVMGMHSGKDVFKSIHQLGIFNPRKNRVYLLETNCIPEEVIKAVENDIICYSDESNEAKNVYILNQKVIDEMIWTPDFGRWHMPVETSALAKEICERVIAEGIIYKAEYTSELEKKKKCFFYMCESDMDTQKKLIDFLRTNGYLPRKKDNTYLDFMFKVRSLEECHFPMYKGYFSGPLRLKQILNLENGEWKESFFEFADYFKRQRIVDQKACEYLGETGWGNKYSMGNLVMHSGDSFNGAYVKNQMKQKGIKAQFLADLLDVNVGTVRNWLNGKSRPYAWYAFAVVVYLDLDESEVIIREKS